MPQLDLAPWSYTLFFVWSILIILPPLKLPHFMDPNTPELRSGVMMYKMWTWPW